MQAECEVSITQTGQCDPKAKGTSERHVVCIGVSVSVHFLKKVVKIYFC